MYTGKPNTNSNIAWHRPQSAASLQQEELMQYSSREMHVSHSPSDHFRLVCLAKGAAGIMALGRIFRKLDSNDGQHLNKKEFFKGIRKTGLPLSDEDTEQLFETFDPGNSGVISIDKFLTEMRPSMSNTRLSVVEKAFKKLDKSGDGVITPADLRGVFSLTSMPRYMSGEESAEKVMKAFLDNFEPEESVDGKVTYEDFLNYYSGISVSIDDDGYFDLMMRQSYKL